MGGTRDAAVGDLANSLRDSGITAEQLAAADAMADNDLSSESDAAACKTCQADICRALQKQLARNKDEQEKAMLAPMERAEKTLKAGMARYQTAEAEARPVAEWKAITRQQIQQACGMVPLSKEDLPHHTPRASGTLEAHYAPAAKVRLMDAKALQTGLDLLGADAAHIAVYARAALRTQSSKLVMRRMPDDASAAAQQLFAALRAFDDQGVKLIWIETPPATPEWEGVRDRLQRAAAA